MIEYFFDNISLCAFKGWTESWSGLFSALERKELEKVDYHGQHGYRFDRTALRYKERVITLTLVFHNSKRLVRDDMNRLMELLSKNSPIRLVRKDARHLRTDVWEVDLINAGQERWFDDHLGQRTFTFHEIAPVKVVYWCPLPKAVITINSPYTLVVSWGDGTTEKVKSGELTHEYTDGLNDHHIIVSGVITEAETTTNLQELCKTLF
jgi:hypothetical protein